MKVRDWMTKDPITVNHDDPVKAAMIALLEYKIRHLPVMSEGQLVGVVSDRDLKQALPSATSGGDPEQYQAFMQHTRIYEVMTRYPITCEPDTDLKEIAQQFCREKIGAIPVVEGEKLVGVISQTDMMYAFLEVLEKEG